MARRETRLSPPVKYFLLTVSRRYCFCESFVLYLILIALFYKFRSFGCLSGPSGFTCWISFAPVFSLFTVESLILFYLLFIS